MIQKRSLGASRRPSPRDVWAKAAARAKRTALEDRLARDIHAHGLPTPEREFTFHPSRRWRLDFAWPEFKIAAEVQGGTGHGVRGRHVQPAGFEADCEKARAAISLGWRLFPFTAAEVVRGVAVATLRVELERAALASGRA